jgi:hypothetical protein
MNKYIFLFIIFGILGTCFAMSRDCEPPTREKQIEAFYLNMGSCKYCYNYTVGPVDMGLSYDSPGLEIELSNILRTYNNLYLKLKYKKLKFNCCYNSMEKYNKLRGQIIKLLKSYLELFENLKEFETTKETTP